MSTMFAASLVTLAQLEAPSRIPVTIVNNQVFLSVSVAGSDPFRVVLDTGMPTPHLLLYQTERVDALRLDLGHSGMAVGGAGGSGESFVARTAPPIDLALGDFTLARVPVLCLPGAGDVRANHDGILGDALFRRFVVRLDVDEGVLELHDPESFVPPDEGAADEVPLRFRGGRAFVDVQVALGSKPPVPAEVVVDLGAGHALSLNDRKGDGSGPFAAPEGTIETSLGRGLSGEIQGRVGRLASVGIGRHRFEHVVASFPVAEHQDPGGVDFRDGNLGAEILLRFNVTFDYAHRRMFLEPSRRFADPFEFGMSGMVFHLQGTHALAVRRVLAGSPAASAGVEAGDVIVAIDGKKVADIGVDAVIRALRVDGKKVAVSILRGGTPRELSIELRRLV